MCVVTSAVLQCARETAYFTIIFVEQQYLFEACLIQSAFFAFWKTLKTNAFVLISTKSFEVLFFSHRLILDHFSHYYWFPQVFISGTKSECKRLLQTILQNRRLCTLLSPYFTPVASPNEFVTLYEKVVAFLSEDNSDVVFMLLTKVKDSQIFSVLWIPYVDVTSLNDCTFKLLKKDTNLKLQNNTYRFY